MARPEAYSAGIPGEGCCCCTGGGNGGPCDEYLRLLPSLRIDPFLSPRSSSPSFLVCHCTASGGTTGEKVGSPSSTAAAREEARLFAAAAFVFLTEEPTSTANELEAAEGPPTGEAPLFG